MQEVQKLRIGSLGNQVRDADGHEVCGNIEGIRARGVQRHKIPGHPGRHAYLPGTAIARVDDASDTVFLTPGITLDAVLDAPPPPEETPNGWHMSDDWWADLLGHYGLYDAEGRINEPFLHPGQR
jgi:hypothetical protein